MLINNSVLVKTLENVSKSRNINYLGSEPTCDITKQFPENLLATEMKQNININE